MIGRVRQCSLAINNKIYTQRVYYNKLSEKKFFPTKYVYFLTKSQLSNFNKQKLFQN